MAEITLRVGIGYRWWFKPMLKVMFYIAWAGIIPSERFISWMVDCGTYSFIDNSSNN